ncbi:MAG: allantoate amidohydrolase [Opitutaceae bacterium]|jgi:allantoate deiminase
MKRDPFGSAALILDRLLRELGRVSDDKGRLTRTFLSPAMRRANRLVGGWMRETGLAVREDALGNLIGRLEGSRPGARTLVLGSHLDTVRDAGRFDGALGVLLPIVALRHLRREGVRLPFALELVGFSEEEGVRFPGAYLGSRGYCGRIRAADLALRDEDGTTVGQCLRKWIDPRGRRAWKRPEPAHSARDLLGYVEVHIEQGPVLEKRGIACGVVSAIAGQTRAKVEFLGRAGHAGTTPMALRRDALAGGAEFVLAAESLARKRPPLVATVGRLEARPGAGNVIAGGAELSLDFRHPEDRRRLEALRTLRLAARQIARRRRLGMSFQVTQDNPSVACSPGLTALLSRSVKARQGRSISLPSGAGHDGVVLSSLAPIAMLFVRCRAGASHCPAEHVKIGDLAAALEIVDDFLRRLARDFHG